MSDLHGLSTLTFAIARLKLVIHGSRLAGRANVNPEAKLLQLRYAFEDLGLNRVAFKTHHENLQSQAAIRKLGAVYEGTFRNHYVMPDGTLRHSVWFSITPRSGRRCNLD